MTINRLSRGVLAATLLAASAYAFAAPVTYTMDPAHTDVVAQWSHFGFSNPIAHFGQVEGTITYDADNVAASKVEVVMPLAGLNSHVAAFAGGAQGDHGGLLLVPGGGAALKPSLIVVYSAINRS